MSVMWWNSYRSCSALCFFPWWHWNGTWGPRCSVQWDLAQDPTNTAGILPLPFHVVVATSLFSHLEPRRQSIIYLRNTAWLCKASSFGRVLRGRRDALKVGPSVPPPHPPPSKPMWEGTLMRLGLVHVNLTGPPRGALMPRHQINQLRGSLDTPVKKRSRPQCN